MSGCIYICQNDVEHAAQGWFKIGFVHDARRVGARMRNLSTTGMIGRFQLQQAWDLPDCIPVSVVERIIHVKLANRRIDPTREFFRGPLEELIREIKETFDFLKLPGILIREAAPTRHGNEPISIRTSQSASGDTHASTSTQFVPDKAMLASVSSVPDEGPYLSLWSLIGCLEGIDDPQQQQAAQEKMHQAWLRTVKRPMKPYPGESGMRANSREFTREVATVGLDSARSLVAWARSVYWLAPVIVQDCANLKLSLHGQVAFHLNSVPAPAVAQGLIRLESDILAASAPYAFLPSLKLSMSHHFTGWLGDHSKIPSFAPTDYSGGEDGCWARIDDEYCWEIGLPEGKGAPFYAVSCPLPVAVAQGIEDPELLVWVRAVWQLLNLVGVLKEAWTLPMPHHSEAEAWVAHAVGTLAAFGQNFPEDTVRQVQAMWRQPLHFVLSGEQKDFERSYEGNPVPYEDLKALRTLQAAKDQELLGPVYSQEMALLRRASSYQPSMTDEERMEVQALAARMRPLVKWFRSPVTRARIKADLGLGAFDYKAPVVVDWVSKHLNEQSRGGSG